jgi:signal transduction histidine kinase
MVLDKLPAELPKAYGERDSIATILTELTTNAEKYSPPDTRVELCAGADEETLRFRVADRGGGINPDHVEHAFERYWQADSSDGQQHPGAGLGLYLVRRLVERQQGWVSLRPREGGGTTAEVRLPRA